MKRLATSDLLDTHERLLEKSGIPNVVVDEYAPEGIVYRLEPGEHLIRTTYLVHPDDEAVARAALGVGEVGQ